MTPDKSDKLTRDMLRITTPAWDSPEFTGRTMGLIAAEADRKVRRKFFWRIYSGITALAIIGFGIAVIVKGRHGSGSDLGALLNPLVKVLGGREVFFVPLLLLLVIKRLIDARMWRRDFSIRSANS